MQEFKNADEGKLFWVVIANIERELDILPYILWQFTSFVVTVWTDG